MRTRDISSDIRHSAARVLDKRADNDIRAERARLGSLGKFAVAVIDKGKGARCAAVLLYESARLADLSAESVLREAYPLERWNATTLTRSPYSSSLSASAERLTKAFRGKVYLVVCDTELAQASHVFAFDPDHGAKRIVRRSRRVYKDISRTKQPKQRYRQRMGSRYDLRAAERPPPRRTRAR